MLSILLLSCGNAKMVHQYNKNIRDATQFDEQSWRDIDIDQEPVAKICMGVAIYSKDLPVNLLPVLLSKIYGVEINLSQKSDLNISFNHSNVCLEDLLNELTDLYNVGFDKNHTGYSMHINSLKTQFFTLNYHNFSREGSSQLTVQNRSFDSAAPSSSSSSDKNSYIETKVTDNFWVNITKNIQNLINFNDPKDSGSNFTIYQESGVIVVNSYPRTLKNIKKFIDKINGSCARQVNIEARILEVNLKEEFYSGINWNALNGNLSFVQQGDYSPQSGFSTQVLRINAGNAKNFNPIITALANQGHVSVLSSPRVSILNNQRGIIKFGSDGYYLTNISSNVQSGATAGTNVVNSSLGLTPIFSGLALDATASIINDREVILHIHPTITRVTEEEKTLTLNQQRTVLPLALIQSREADTIVKANSGDIIVIGGLMQNSVEMDRSNFNTKNSFLNKLLKAFGNKQDYNLKSELVILLRPVIDDMGIGIEALDKHLIEDKLD